MLTSEGSSRRSCVKASSPPAEAPIPTMGNDSSRACSSMGTSAVFRFVDSAGRETCLLMRAPACLFFTGLRSASLCANQQTLEDNSHVGSSWENIKERPQLSYYDGLERDESSTACA